MATKKVEKIREKRQARIRAKLCGTQSRPRLSVFRSARHIYVQAVADDVGKTIAEASTLSEELKGKIEALKKVDVAKEVGKLVSNRLKAIGIEEAVFDRGRFLYHGRIKALAEGAREMGLKF
ncbi:MAG: 50S ribosomal protein L18 [Syntrophales bacterium]|nr:50S ribosomal protein L18 [Syntrophales bacterium]